MKTNLMGKQWSKKYVSDEEIVRAAKMSVSMSRAAAEVKLKYETFARRAKELGVFNPNQGGKGILDGGGRNKKEFPINEIIYENKHPHFGSARLRKKLLRLGIKKNECEICGISEWNGKALVIELHHKDGDKTNNHISNLEMNCPNCHSQSDSFSKHRQRKQKYGDVLERPKRAVC